MNIYGKKTYLRAMELEDMEMYREMINDPHIERMEGAWSFPVSTLAQQEWFNRVRSDKNNVRFTVVDRETDTAVGMVTLTAIDWKNRSAFHGIKLATRTPKRVGIGTDAVMTLMQYAFEELQLVRLDTTWVEYNEPSIKLYKKCGWKIEGRKEMAYFKAGSYHAVLFGGILVDAYLETKKKLNW